MATGSDPQASHVPPSPPPPPTLDMEYPEASPSPSKRPKTETLTLNSALSPSPSSSSKGKSKIEDEPEVECCGICLLEEGKAIRGWIDCCDHRFCFICIMEWAKVESRCPLCKRRFETIRRPPKIGLFPSERVVNVPVRDQYYNGLGNSTIGPTTRYVEVQCTVCHGVSDECLLLLCDLCDSAAHTYCVGLGVTVPEGDWFCHDCTLLKDEHTESEVDHNCDNPTSMDNFNGVRLAKEPVSIRDIIGECDRFGNERPFPRNRLPSSVVPETPVTSTELGARTLHRCRNVQVRIQALRENWNAFRTGSLNFSSNLRDIFNVPVGDRSDQQKFSSFSAEQSTSQRDSSSSVLPDERSYDVDKAWKMMNAAKSIVRKNGMTLSKNPVSNSTAPKGAGRSSLTLNTSNGKQFRKMDHGTSGFKNSQRSCTHEKNDDKYKMFEKAKQEGCNQTENKRYIVGDSANASGFRELSSSRKGQMAVQVNNHRKSCENMPQKTIFGVGIMTTTPAQRSSQIASDISCAKRDANASSSTNYQMGTVSSTLAERSSLRASEISRAKQGLRASSSCSSQKGMVKALTDSKVLKADEAKSEIQSLVKLNLKLLTRDDKLEVDAFKEVARHATHSILATCGLEPLKVGMRSFPGSVCHHGEEMRQLHRSTLMPDSCRECFYAFVKDVVSTIKLERKGHSRV